MSERFDVGEVAIVVRADDWPAYLGSECIIVGDLETRRAKDPRGNYWIFRGYLVRMPDGLQFLAQPSALRKKRPPAELGSWKELESLLHWNPEKSGARA